MTAIADMEAGAVTTNGGRASTFSTQAESAPMGPVATVLLGSFMMVLGLAVVALLLVIWPAVGSEPTPDHVEVLGMTLVPGQALLILVVASSALGSYVHAATSFTDYVGNRRLTGTWLWWYLLRTFIGCALALIFYFAMRGGFLTGAASDSSVNGFGVAAMSGLVGLFSKQATDKLREVFDTLFRTQPGGGDDQREDSLTNPVPTIAAIEPPSAVAGAAAVTLRISGTGFVRDSQVRVARLDGVVLERSQTLLSPTLISVRLDKEDVLQAGTLHITVFNPGPGGGTSASARFEVVPAPEIQTSGI